MVDFSISNSNLNKVISSSSTIFNLPIEVLCTIFSYLDRKSMKNATATCQFWFEIIRSDKKLSKYIRFGKYGLKTLNDLQTKIDQSEWIWERWPCLKIIEFGRSHKLSANETMDSIKMFNFEQCPNMEKIVR